MRLRDCSSKRFPPQYVAHHILVQSFPFILSCCCRHVLLPGAEAEARTCTCPTHSSLKLNPDPAVLVLVYAAFTEVVCHAVTPCRDRSSPDPVCCLCCALLPQAEAAERARAEVRVLKEQLAAAAAQQEATAAAMHGECRTVQRKLG